MMQYIKTLPITVTGMVVSCLMFLPASFAAIDVDMHLNDGGFVSFDHFLAELRLNNHDAVVPDAQIFGVLDVYGSFFFWPSFETAVDFETRDILEGDMTVNFLEFDFPDIDDFIPFGPMNFWGAWVVSGDQYGYDVQEFWLDDEHKWTPTPTGTYVPPSSTPTVPPGSPTNTAIPPTFTPTPGGNPTSTPPPAGQWEDASENIPETADLRDLYANGDNVWITGGTDKIFYSSQNADLGTVLAQDVPAGSGNTKSIAIRSNGEGYIITLLGKILHSADAASGEWTTISGPGGSLYSVSFPPSGSTGYTCGSSGRIFSITGTTVALDTTVGSYTLTSITFPVSDEGWVCGGPAIRHRDSTGWLVGDQNYSTGNGYNSIHFIDNQNGWAVASNGTIIHTTNGHDWLTQPTSYTSNLSDVFFLNANEGWAVGNFIILHTMDGGQNWVREAEELTEGKVLSSVYFTESNKGYVTGSGKVFLRYR